MNVPIQHNHVYPRDFSLLSGLYIYFTTIFQINSSISEIKSFRSLFPLHHCQIRCIALYPTLAISTCYRWAWTTISTFFDPRNSQVKQLTFRLHIIVLSKKRFQGTSSNPLWLLPIETASKIAYKHRSRLLRVTLEPSASALARSKDCIPRLTALTRKVFKYGAVPFFNALWVTITYQIWTRGKIPHSFLFCSRHDSFQASTFLILFLSPPLSICADEMFW